MSEPEHLVGDTAFYDVQRDVQFRTSMEIQLDLDSGAWEIKRAGARTGSRLTITNPVFLRVMRLVIQMMRREAKVAAPVWPRWKHRTTELTEVCPECEDRRWHEDAVTGEVWPCPACNVGW